MKMLLFVLTALSLTGYAQEALPEPEFSESVSQPKSAKLNFQGQIKKKMKNIAVAQLKHEKGVLNLIFDSEHLQPGKYQLSMAETCKPQEKGRVLLGEFKTQSGFISTEFNHTDKGNPFDLEVPHYLLLTKKEKGSNKTTSISCVPIFAPPEAPAQASLD